MARRGCAALLGSCLDHYVGEARLPQLITDQRGVVIAVWRARQKTWWIARKNFRERVRHIVREQILLNAIPYVEQVTSSGFEDPLCLTVARLAVGEEHDAKLATNEIESSILERQCQGIRFAPGDAAVGGQSRSSVVKHRLVEIGYDVAGVWRKSWRQCSSDHATASSSFRSEERRVGKECRSRW